MMIASFFKEVPAIIISSCFFEGYDVMQKLILVCSQNSGLATH